MILFAFYAFAYHLLLYFYLLLYFKNLFAITPLDWNEWYAVLAISFPVIILDEILKAVSRWFFVPRAVSKRSDALKKGSGGKSAPSSPSAKDKSEGHTAAATTRKSTRSTKGKKSD